MTQNERLIVSAYTGVLMTDMDQLHDYINRVLGRPVWTHELRDEKVLKEIQEKVRPAFLALCGNE